MKEDGGGRGREGVSALAGGGLAPCQPLINDVVRGGAVKRCGIRGHAGSGGAPHDLRGLAGLSSGRGRGWVGGGGGGGGVGGGRQASHRADISRAFAPANSAGRRSLAIG